MLTHPWDAALDDEEWRSWLADGHDVGQLVVNGLPGQPPTVVPTHFTVEDTPTGTVLLEQRAAGRDLGAAAQQRRRLARIGTWRPR